MAQAARLHLQSIPPRQLLQAAFYSRPVSTARLGHRACAVQAAMAAQATATAPAVGVPVDGTSSLAVVQPESYEEQLSAKVAALRDMFKDFRLPEMEVHRSEPIHYRMRAEFRVWHENDESYYIMFDTSRRDPNKNNAPSQVRIDEFPVGSLLMNSLMREVCREYLANSVLRHRLFQVNFHTTLSGEAMVTLVYHKKLDDVWREAAVAARDRIQKTLAAECTSLSFIGRSRKQKLELDRSHVIERMVVGGQEYVYKQVEGSFSQPNGGMCQQMLEWAQVVTSTSGGGDLLELYCGNGNFTIPLAKNFKQVVATEVSKSSVEAARHNIEANGVQNIFMARMSSEEFTATWRANDRTKRRLQGLDFDTLDLGTILVDPPRAGLDDATVELLSGFRRIVYISCNPATLAANLAAIKDSHSIERFAVFDQFPYSHHVECGVYLAKRSTDSQAGAAEQVLQ